MAAWQHRATLKWFDPESRDFTSPEPIEFTCDAVGVNLANGGAHKIIAHLAQLLGVESVSMEHLDQKMRVARKDNDYE